MKHTHTLLLLLLTLVSCTDHRQPVRDGLDLTGAWVLRHVEYPSGTEQDYALGGDGTSCLIYDSQSQLYECNISTTPTGLLIQPTAKATVTLVDKGGGEWLYLEDGDLHPSASPTAPSPSSASASSTPSRATTASTASGEPTSATSSTASPPAPNQPTPRNTCSQPASVSRPGASSGSLPP